MSINTNLDAVIRHIARREELLPGESLVVLDARTAEVLDRPPGLLSFRQVNLYAVSNAKTAHCAGPNYKLISGVLLEISFDAGVPNGRETQAAQSLQRWRDQLREASLEATLNTRIRHWTADFVRDRGEDKMLDLRDELQFYLKNQALAELGLHLHPNVAYKHGGQLEPLLLLSEVPFPVHVQGFDDAQLVSFEGELAVSDPILAVAQWKKPDELRQMVTEHIKTYCQHRLTLNQFVESFKTAHRDTIMEELNQRFKPFGRRFNFLVLKNENEGAQPRAPRIFQFEETVKEKIKDYGSEIAVQNRVLIEVANLALFRASKDSADLEKWVHEVVQSAIKKRLMAATYKELLLEQDRFVKEVRDVIRADADKIGLRITEHIVLPELKERRLVTEGFLVDFQNIQFQTGGSDPMPIALNIFVKGRLEEQGLHNLKDIYLGEKADVFKSIETAVLGKIRETVIRLSAEKMFLKYEFPSEGEQHSTQEELCRAVQELLVSEFQAEPVSLQITINQGQNELIAKAKSLLGRTNELLHTHKALAGNGADLNFHFQYRILRVHNDGWHLFFQNAENRAPDEIVAEIDKLLPGQIDSVFQNFYFEDKVATGLEAERIRHEALKKGAFDRVGLIFGLELLLLNHRREKYQGEVEVDKNLLAESQQLGELDRAYKLKSLQEKYAELDELKRKLRTEQAEEMPVAHEVERLKRLITLLEEELRGDRFGSVRGTRDSFLAPGSLTTFDKPRLQGGPSDENIASDNKNEQET